MFECVGEGVVVDDVDGFEVYCVFLCLIWVCVYLGVGELLEMLFFVVIDCFEWVIVCGGLMGFYFDYCQVVIVDGDDVDFVLCVFLIVSDYCVVVVYQVLCCVFFFCFVEFIFCCYVFSIVSIFCCWVFLLWRYMEVGEKL